MRAPIAVLAGIAALVAVGVAATGPVPARSPAATRPVQDANQAYARFFEETQQTRAAAQPEFQVSSSAFSRIGVIAEGERISVANMTVTPGQYLVSYTFEARLEPGGETARLRCGIADANGSGDLLVAASEPARVASGWRRTSYATSFGAPDMTISVRCFAESDLVGLLSVRDIRLSAARLSEESS